MAVILDTVVLVVLNLRTGIVILVMQEEGILIAGRIGAVEISFAVVDLITTGMKIITVAVVEDGKIAKNKYSIPADNFSGYFFALLQRNQNLMARIILITVVHWEIKCTVLLKHSNENDFTTVCTQNYLFISLSYYGDISESTTI